MACGSCSANMKVGKGAGEAVDGKDVVVKAHQLAPDVVVLDFAMPVMNGIEAARQIRRERPNTAIVLCSMYLDSHLATVAHDAGITSVLSKGNLGQVIEGVEAGLRGQPFTEITNLMRLMSR